MESNNKEREGLVVDLRPTTEWTEKSQWRLCLLANIPPSNGRTLLQELFDEAYETDPFPAEILTCLRDGTRHHWKITLGDCGDDDGHFRY